MLSPTQAAFAPAHDWVRPLLTARIITDKYLLHGGLGTDVGLYTEALHRAGFIKVIHVGADLGMPDSRREEVVTLNVFLEHLHPAYFPLGRFNWFMVNQEIAHASDLYDNLDVVLCKTSHASSIVVRLVTSPTSVAWTLHSSFDPTRKSRSPRDWGMVLHAPGKSRNKNTSAVVEAWEAHPEYPVLHLVARGEVGRCVARAKKLANVIVHDERITDSAMADLQARCGLHICTSEAEGWGHYLNEGRASAAVLMVTDCPPMDELVDGTCAIMLSPRAVGRFNRYGPGLPGSVSCRLSSEDVEYGMSQYLGMDDEARAEFGRLVRQRYEHDDKVFRARMADLLASVSSTEDRGRYWTDRQRRSPRDAAAQRERTGVLGKIFGGLLRTG